MQISQKFIDEGLELLGLMKLRFEETKMGDCSRATVHFFNLLDKINKSKRYHDIRKKREREENKEIVLD